jgi:hypothetical protein
MMTTNSHPLLWEVDASSSLVTFYTTQSGKWTLHVAEYPKSPQMAPDDMRFLAQVHSTHGTAVALKPTWCASLDDAKQMCIFQALIR